MRPAVPINKRPNESIPESRGKETPVLKDQNERNQDLLDKLLQNTITKGESNKGGKM